MSVSTIRRRLVVGALMVSVVGITAFATDSVWSQKGKRKRAKRVEYRTIDGSENNRRNPDWGKAFVPLLRAADAAYDDGISAPSGVDRPSPRTISNLVAAQSESVPNSMLLTDMTWQWGQFLDHDLDLTESANPPEALPIFVPPGDPWFDPTNSGNELIQFFRSLYDPNSGVTGPRQQLNEITAYIDGSNVYGSDEETAAFLRTFSDGLLKTSAGDLLPLDDEGFFVAGDIRANEQLGLASMHTLFVREHNRWARILKRRHRNYDDEKLYQESRRRVIAIMQVITYEEFLPALLGRRALPRYRGYDRNCKVGIMNIFSTASYRFGHSMLNAQLLRLDNDANVIPEGNIALRDAFFNPAALTGLGIEPYLMGLTRQQAQEIDTMVVDDLRNFLFGPPGSGGFDLASLNIQRGRDHGLPDYNTMREAFGLCRVESFDEITSDEAVQLALEEAYGSVDSIDPWVGGLAEDHVRRAAVGPLLFCVFGTQFTNLRDGDRFWYEREFSGAELRRLRRTTLADVIIRNTDLTNVQKDVFHLPRGR